MEDKRVFIDTNVLLAATDVARSHHCEAKAFISNAAGGSWRLFASAQVFREYLVVATRPIQNNGLGLSPEGAARNVYVYQRLVQVLPEGQDSHNRLVSLVIDHQLSGKRIHDANIVAVMMTQGLRQLNTYNPQDFKPFQQIELLRNPAQ